MEKKDPVVEDEAAAVVGTAEQPPATGVAVQDPPAATSTTDPATSAPPQSVAPSAAEEAAGAGTKESPPSVDEPHPLPPDDQRIAVAGAPQSETTIPVGEAAAPVPDEATLLKTLCTIADRVVALANQLKIANADLTGLLEAGETDKVNAVATQENANIVYGIVGAIYSISSMAFGADKAEE